MRVSLASVAVLGIGGALTSAAWTDQVFYTAPAQAASFNLEGSASQSGPWAEYNTESGALVIPVSASQFGNLVPEEEHSIDVYVRNSSTVAANIEVTAVGSGDLFAVGTTATVTATPAQTTANAGAVTAVTVTLSAGALPTSFQGKTGSILVTVTGTTD